MSVTLYRSTDGSAPTLTGEAGSLTTLLIACLVDGYGAKAGAGWSVPYSSTNAYAFKQGTGGTDMYCQVNDNGPGAGTYKEARMVGYDVMTAYDTGSNKFPTAAQLANGLFIRKSASLDATTRPWVVLADERTFYLFMQPGDTAGNWLGIMFGEFYSLKTGGDAYRTMIIGRVTENVTTQGPTADYMDAQILTLGTGALPGHYIVRDDQASVGAVAAAKAGDLTVTGGAGNQPFNGVMTYPNRPDSASHIAQVRVFHNSSFLRGFLRGLWHWCHPITAVADGDTFSGTGALAGKEFLLLKQGGAAGVFCLETSNTWESN